MRKLPIILLTVLAWVVGAQAAEIGVGGVAADTTGYSYDSWYAKFSMAADSATSTDTLYCIFADISDSLGTGANAYTKDLTIVGDDDYTISWSGASGVCGYYRIDNCDWILTDVNWDGGLYVYGENLTWTGGSITHPGTDYAEAPSGKYGLAFADVSPIAATFTDVDISLTGLDAKGVKVSGGNGSGVAITLDGCTMSSDSLFELSAVANNSYLRILDTDWTGDCVLYSKTTVSDLDSLAVDGCTWTDGCIIIGGANVLRLNDNTIRAHSTNSGLGGANAWCTLLDDNVARAVTHTANNYSLDTEPAGSMGGFWSRDADTLDSFTSYDNTVNGTGAYADSFYVYFGCTHSLWDVVDIHDETLTAGVFNFNEARGDTFSTDYFDGTDGWSAYNISIIHAPEYQPPVANLPNAAFQWLGNNTTITNLDIDLSTGLCNHGVLTNDDAVESNTWSPADSGLFAHGNTFSGCDWTIGATVDGNNTYGALVSKGRGTTLVNCTLASTGSSAGVTQLISSNGDSLDVINCNLSVADTDSSCIFKDGKQGGHQSVAARMINCKVTGSAEYVFNNFANSDTTAGWTENNNGILLSYTTFNGVNSTTMDDNSTTDENSWRMKTGGEVLSSAPKYDDRFNAVPIGRWDAYQQAQRNVQVDDLYVGVGSPWPTPKYAWACWDSLGNAGTRLPLFELIPYGASASQLLSIELNHNLFMAEADSALVDSVWIQGTVLDKSEIYPANDAPR